MNYKKDRENRKLQKTKTERDQKKDKRLQKETRIAEENKKRQKRD